MWACMMRIDTYLHAYNYCYCPVIAPQSHRDRNAMTLRLHCDPTVKVL